jgi:hypothetical protein
MHFRVYCTEKEKHVFYGFSFVAAKTWLRIYIIL